ncbi:hypothetical protein GCM10010978_25990 [Compostibacillus humi]|uniref:Uncharacterized protein n=1 Tax=Compostibacillus humi TaxID=1245525 RepID=A0A8J2TUA2_9BACI|nr:hypothetical protein [Compostibacillus humi]GFZ84453.1 hypothetical protein GCM10010978_25990 [Compostibacillus humi]
MEQDKNEFDSFMMVASPEFLAFSLLGLGLEIGLDLLVVTALEALVPNSTGILIVARVAYELIKLGKKVRVSNQNKQAVRECVNIRLNYLYDKVIKGTNGEKVVA